MTTHTFPMTTGGKAFIAALSEAGFIPPKLSKIRNAKWIDGGLLITLPKNKYGIANGCGFNVGIPFPVRKIKLITETQYLTQPPDWGDKFAAFGCSNRPEGTWTGHAVPDVPGGFSARFMTRSGGFVMPYYYHQNQIFPHGDYGPKLIKIERFAWYRSTITADVDRGIMSFHCAKIDDPAGAGSYSASFGRGGAAINTFGLDAFIGGDGDYCKNPWAVVVLVRNATVDVTA